MAKFMIGYNDYFGFCSSERADAYATIELTDEQVERLVALIRETGETDVYSLELDEKHPDIFEVLEDACYSVVYDSDLRKVKREVYYDTIYTWGAKRVLMYARGNGFIYDEQQDDDEVSAAIHWLNEFMEEDDNLEEFIDLIGWVPECIDISDYEIVIPVEILRMAGME